MPLMMIQAQILRIVSGIIDTISIDSSDKNDTYRYEYICIHVSYNNRCYIICVYKNHTHMIHNAYTD